VQALSRLHDRSRTLRFDGPTIDRVLRREARHYAALGQMVYLHHRSSHAVTRGLSRTQLVTLREESLERVFRLLGLRFDQRDIYSAYRGITSHDPGLRSNAVEFVDNLLDWKTSRLLLPLLDDATGRQAVDHAQGLFGVALTSWPRVFEYLLEADDSRLNAMALRAKGVPLTADQQAALHSIREAAASFEERADASVTV